MRVIFLTVSLLLKTLWIAACPVCERNQPAILRGITHGAGPEGKWDYIIVWATVAIVICTLFFSIKWLIHPGEKSDRHIKRFILNEE